MQVFVGRTTNGDSAVVTDFSFLNSVYCWGVFDGATVTLRGSLDNVEWFDLATFTAKGVTGLGVKAPYKRATVSGAGANTNINMNIE